MIKFYMKELLLALCMFGWFGLYANQPEDHQNKNPFSCKSVK
jgi:hypothetical protein